MLSSSYRKNWKTRRFNLVEVSLVILSRIYIISHIKTSRFTVSKERLMDSGKIVETAEEDNI
jgi:hypothetical protein